MFFEELNYRAWKEAHKYWRRDANIPVDVYLDEAITDDELDGARSELDGAIWFVSLLSRIDGLVLFMPELDVLGFGVEINVPEVPTRIFMAARESGSPASLRSHERFGTRHRSMMRYCASVPNSIGVVISQDGDVRIMTSTKAGVLVWENIKLQLDVPDRSAPPRCPAKTSKGARP